MSMFSFRKKISNRYWLLLSSGVFAAHLIIGMALVMLANGSIVNRVITPIYQYIDVFKLTWPEQPLGSLHFLATKSIFVLSKFDPRSSLNLWTLEYDFYTLLVYIMVSLTLGRILAHNMINSISMPGKGVIGFCLSAFFISASITYMTVLEHCSGATWVGFVSLYGLGLKEFELYPIYQIICALIGILGFIGTAIWLSNRKNSAFS